VTHEMTFEEMYTTKCSILRLNYVTMRTWGSTAFYNIQQQQPWCFPADLLAWRIPWASSGSRWTQRGFLFV